MELRRRRVPRQEAGWFGKCLVEDDPEAMWCECRVIDVSIIGAGLEVFGLAHGDLVGRRMVVEVQAPTGASVSVRFVGVINNAGVVPGGGVRFGMEFVGLSKSERSILNMLEQMQVAW
ncbi:MAG TPA: hypothetical protein VMU76_06975 [Acidimicrobiales bacterium]|nr:hypothetical protein [Acidimicrobiales bacterium]